MESLESLKIRKRQLENELQSITKINHKDVQWGPGVLDKHNSESYTYKEYTDPKGYKLAEELEKVKNLINTYAQRAKEERDIEAAIRDSQITKYQYTAGSKVEETTNPAIAARYNAQHRLFSKSKLQQTMLKLTGQRKKFNKLWLKAVTINKEVQQQTADELNKMFR